MTQQFLFPDARPARSRRARRTDPQTSHDAAVQHEASGRMAEQQEVVLCSVRSFPDATSAELAEWSWGELDRYVYARRLPDLERLGKVRRGEPRLCSVSRRMAITWRAT